MIVKKSENVLLLILKYFREAKCLEACTYLKRVLVGQEPTLLHLDIE
jgi:hypothetical protein